MTIEKDGTVVENGRIVAGPFLDAQKADVRKRTAQDVATLQAGKVIEFTEDQLAINRRLDGIEERGGLGKQETKSK